MILGGRLSAPAIPMLMIAISCAAGQDDPSGKEMFGSEHTVSIATGRPQSVRTAPAVATVITAEDIRNYGFRNAIEALSLVPGFHVGFRQELFPDIAVRGFTDLGSSNTLFLLDGIASHQIATGDQMVALGTIPLDMIERIEVTRGPGSSVYGADAFSAVVNVITKKRTESQSLTISGGSYDTGNARLLLGTSGENGAVTVGAEVTSTDGWSPFITADQASVLDDSLGFSSSYAPAEANSDRRELGAMVNISYGQTQGMLRLSRWDDLGTGVGIGGSIDPAGKISFATKQARVSHDLRLGDNLSTSLVADFSYFTREFDDVHWLIASPLFPDGAVMDAENSQASSKLHADGRYDGFERHSLAFGAGYERIRYKIEEIDLNYALIDAGPVPAIPGIIEADEPSVDFTRRVVYAYLQDEWLIAPKWNLALGVRVDDYSDVGTQVSPRAALVWTPTPDWTAKLLYGEGYRAPLLLETHDLGIPQFLPNVDLDPQHLRTVDLSLEYSPSPQLSLRINVFHHNTVDQIEGEYRGFGVLFRNVGDQVGDGVEFEGRWTINDRWSLRGWYAYQYNKDDDTGENEGYSPQHRAFAALQYKHDKWYFNLRGNVVGDRARIARDTRDEPDEYARLDLLGRYDFNKHLSVQLDVRNLLNSNDEEASASTVLVTDYPLPERNYYASLEIRF